MAKQSGLGDNLYISGYDLSGDVGSLQSISARRSVLDVTAINKSAYERIVGLRDGEINFTAFWNDVAGQEHVVLSALPRTDVHAMYCRGTTLGNAAATIVGKQVNYDPTRGADGSLTMATQILGNGNGLEWGQLLTAGQRTDTGATNGTSVDYGATSTAFGLAAYLQVFSFSGTDVTVKLQDSADNSSFSDITSAAFTQITGGAPLCERIETGLTATVRRYVRVATVTTGGFSSLVFVVSFVRYLTAIG